MKHKYRVDTYWWKCAASPIDLPMDSLTDIGRAAREFVRQLATAKLQDDLY